MIPLDLAARAVSGRITSEEWAYQYCLFATDECTGRSSYVRIPELYNFYRRRLEPEDALDRQAFLEWLPQYVGGCVYVANPKAPYLIRNLEVNIPDYWCCQSFEHWFHRRCRQTQGVAKHALKELWHNCKRSGFDCTLEQFRSCLLSGWIPGVTLVKRLGCYYVKGIEIREDAYWGDEWSFTAWLDVERSLTRLVQFSLQQHDDSVGDRSWTGFLELHTFVTRHHTCLKLSRALFARVMEEEFGLVPHQKCGVLYYFGLTCVLLNKEITAREVMLEQAIFNRNSIAVPEVTT